MKGGSEWGKMGSSCSDSGKTCCSPKLRQCVGVGRRRHKGLCANRSGAKDRKECKMTCTLGPVEPSVEMLGDGAGVCRLQPAGPAHPDACLFIALERRMLFTFFKGSIFNGYVGLDFASSCKASNIYYLTLKENVC